MEILEHIFHYETELLRMDCPASNVWKWLDQQALAIATNKTREDWRVLKTHLEQQKDGTHLYRVTMTKEL